MASVSQVQSTDFDLDRYTDTPRVYVIASQPRSGSHYLAHLLRATGQAGVPLEYFHTAHWKSWMKRCRQSDPRGAFRLLCQLRTTPNGSFGVKTHWKQFQYACRLRLEQDLRDAEFIQITRNDLLGQAISLVIASQTGAWIHGHEQSAPPEYSFTAVQRAVAQLVAARGNWDRFFAFTGIAPLRISYEDLTARRDDTMMGVCRHIGITWHPSEPVEMRVQRTELSDEWRERFLCTLPDLHEPDAFWRGEFGMVGELVPRHAVRPQPTPDDHA